MLAASETTAQMLRDNWHRVAEQVAAACIAAGRDPKAVQIVGVSKYVQPELAWQLSQAGCSVLGENRPQALWEKFEYYQSQPSLRPPTQWHLIGHLQRNKLRRTLPMLSMLHSLDSLRLAEAVSQEAQAHGRVLRVLLEVKVTGEASKTGMATPDVHSLLARTKEFPGLEICGLMAMSSLDANAGVARRQFEQVRELRDSLQDQFRGQVALPELSMGMSGDFREAIAAGATLVRIGTSLWHGIL